MWKMQLVVRAKRGFKRASVENACVATRENWLSAMGGPSKWSNGSKIENGQVPL